MMDFIIANLKTPLEVVLLAAVFYYLLLLFRGTRGAAVFMGFVIALFCIWVVTQLFQFEVINWLLGRFLTLLAIAVLVIFQPELRRALAELGSQYVFSAARQRGELIDVLVETAATLSTRKCGALIAIEREVGFRGISEKGVMLDARATPELLATIFHPHTPLHDGGVIIRGDRVLAAACVFPLTQREGLSASMGMRHRAALGMTEESDAVVLVVSEQTGDISVAHRGQFVKGLDPLGLRAFLSSTLMPPERRGNALTDWLRKVFEPLLVLRPPAHSSTAQGFSTGEESFAESAAQAPAARREKLPETDEVSR
jgi:diadenylate cyclase